MTGTWSGTLEDPNFDPDKLSWTATQNGTSVTGPAVLTMAPPPGESEVRVVNGTMTATLSGTEASLTLTLPAGSFTPFGGPPACSVKGTATAQPSATSLQATMTRTFDASCIGIVSKGATDTVPLALTRQ
jgi:hypothetical protein